MRKRGCLVLEEAADMKTQCKGKSEGMMFDAIVSLLLSSFASSIPGSILTHVHGFGVPMCCPLLGNLSISIGTEVAVSFLGIGGLV